MFERTKTPAHGGRRAGTDDRRSGMVFDNRVLVLIDREPLITPGLGYTKIENATDAWLEVQRLIAPYLLDTLLIFPDHPMRAIRNYDRAKIADFYVDPGFDEDYKAELRGVTLEYVFSSDEDWRTGVYRVSDLPRSLFFSAVVTPRGRWVDTPWGSKAEYFEGVLDEYEDRLAVVVATADLKHAEELH